MRVEGDADFVLGGLVSDFGDEGEEFCLVLGASDDEPEFGVMFGEDGEDLFEVRAVERFRGFATGVEEASEDFQVWFGLEALLEKLEVFGVGDIDGKAVEADVVEAADFFGFGFAAEVEVEDSKKILAACRKTEGENEGGDRLRYFQIWKGGRFTRLRQRT